MSTVAILAAVVAVFGVAVVYGTDLFCALVVRPAARDAADSSIADLIGRIHEFGDRRMPVPGVIGIVATGAAVWFSGNATARTAAVIALVALLAWLAVYVRISAPINKRLSAAATEHAVPADTRELQQRWDRVIWLRSALQTVAMGGLLAVVVAH